MTIEHTAYVDDNAGQLVPVVCCRRPLKGQVGSDRRGPAVPTQYVVEWQGRVRRVYVDRPYDKYDTASTRRCYIGAADGHQGHTVTFPR